MVKIFIDPGHGGSDPGAVANGLKEKDLTLKISKKIRDILKGYNGVTVKLSRENDKTLSLKQRTDMANKWGADYLISVHVNAGGGTGFESFTYNGNYRSKAATNKKRSIIHDEIMKQLSGVRDRGKKEANYHMVRESSMAAMLTENLFIDNVSDATKLKSNTWINKIAQGHANGIIKAFGLKKKTNSKPKPSASGVTTYKIKTGDTLSSIAKKFDTTIEAIRELNNIKNPNMIYAGDTIKIPSQKPVYHTVKRGDTVSALAIQYGSTQSQIKSWNNLKDINKIYVGQKLRVK